MSNANQDTVLIAGAGIAGLTSALFLEACGLPTKVFERRENASAEGAGIQLTPNAMRVFDRLGLAKTIRDNAFEVNTLTVRNGKTGKPVVTVPFGDVFRKTGYPSYLVIHRHDLMTVLCDALSKTSSTLAYGRPFESLERNGTSGVTAVFGGMREEGRCLIGADGIWSKIRPLFNDRDLTFENRVAYRCLVDKAQVPNGASTGDLTVWLGPNAHFVHYPVGKDRLNLVCVVRGEERAEKWSTPARKKDVLFHYGSWAKEATNLISGGENWTRWPLFTVEPDGDWTHNRVALIGDAAHAMVPFLAQGGAMAIEDAAVLAHALASNADAKDALLDYQRERQERVFKVWVEAHQNGRRYHWRGPMAMARDFGLRQIGGEGLARRYNWIYGWQPPALRD
ncbi:MAG: FAD-dependent monooxygenase [Pseudomonadota bacterium]